jgi:integrase
MNLTNKTKITKATIAKHLSQGNRDKYTRQTIRDTLMPGLALIINKSPTGSWVFSYTPRGKRPDGRRYGTRHVKLGDSSTHSIGGARDAAGEIKTAVLQGRDTQAENLEQRQERERVQLAAKTIEHAIAGYTQAVQARNDVAGQYKHNEVAHAVSVAQLLGLDTSLKEIKGIKVVDAVRNTGLSQSTRWHLASSFRRMLDWAVGQEWLEINPMLTVPRERRIKSAPSREDHLDLDALARLWHASESEHESVQALFRFMLLVPARSREVAHLDWSQIDLTTGIWTQPAKSVKNKRTHKVPLAPAALEILKARQWVTKRKGLVFPSPKAGNVFDGHSKLKLRLSKMAEIRPHTWRYHDTRRSFVTTLADCGHDETTLDLCLNHAASASRSGVLGVYQKASRWDDRVRAMSDWADRLMVAVADKAPAEEQSA